MGVEMLRYAQHDSMVTHAVSRRCHPEPQRRVSLDGRRDASLRSACQGCPPAAPSLSESFPLALATTDGDG